MKKLSSAILLFGIFLSGILFGSDIKLMEPCEAIRLIGNKDVVFVSGDSADTYEKSHIIGSVEMYAHHLHHSDIMGNMLCAPLYRCPEEAQEYIRSKGIKNNQIIIAYDNFLGPNATGVHSFFESFGHKDIRVLNGGLDGIKALDPNQQVFDTLKAEQKEIKKQIKEAKKAERIDEENKLNSEIENIKAKMNMLEPKLLVQGGKEKKHEESDYQLDPNHFNLQYIADKAEVKKAMDDILENGKESKFAIIDTRSMEEIIGEKKMDSVARGGHIPGAKFIEWKNITDMDKKKSFKTLADMQKVFDKAGITRDQTIYAYCHVGSGSSSHIISALRLLGYEKVKVFTGSWDVWGNDMNLPIRR